MKLVILFAILTASFVDSLDSGLRVKFDVGLGVGSNYFIKVPQTVHEAVAMKWSLMDRPPAPLPSLVMYCASELVVCTLFDPDNIFVAGVQVALPLNDFKGAGFDWNVQGFIPWTPAVASGEKVTYMTKQLYFISEETLKKSAEARNQAATAKQVLQEKSVWITGFNQKLMEVPTDVDGILKAGFTEQACIPAMGHHYYYNMTSDTACTADSLLNWFPLVNDGKLSGIGFVAIGALEEKPGQTFYFERPSKLVVEVTVPRGPQCLYDLAHNPTFTTMHIYFVDKPYFVWCSLF